MCVASCQQIYFAGYFIHYGRRAQQTLRIVATQLAGLICVVEMR